MNEDENILDSHLENEEELETIEFEGDAENPELDPEMSEEERKARENGWKPKEEWHGEARNHMDYETFNRKRNDELYQLRNELRETRSELSNLHKGMSDWRKNEYERAYKRAQRQLESRKQQAKDDGDVDELDRIYQEESELNKDYSSSASETKKNTSPQSNQLSEQEQYVVDDWISRNQWFKSDPELQDYAIYLNQSIARQNPSLTLQENLMQVNSKVKNMFPHKFKNIKRERLSRVNNSQRSGIVTSNNKKTFDDLPKEAQDAYKAYKNTGLYKQDDSERQEYVDLYFKS